MSNLDYIDQPNHQLPLINVLEAIKPTNAGLGGDTLHYNNLIPAVDENKVFHQARLEAFDTVDPNSLAAEAKARELKAEELLIYAREAVYEPNQVHREQAARNFTQTSIDRYGQPDPVVAVALLQSELTAAGKIQPSQDLARHCKDTLVKEYGLVLRSSTFASVEPGSIQLAGVAEATSFYRTALKRNYQGVLDLVDDTKKDVFKPHDILDLFKRALEWLTLHDDKSWEQWQAVMTDGGTLSVEAADRCINIGSRREPIPKATMTGLIAHELLTHALRANNGYRQPNAELATGLPGYIDAEEGLGIVAEQAITGALPSKITDRYLDVALALGIIDGNQRSRQQMFELTLARNILRRQVDGKLREDQLSSMQRISWTHVDRIYRGGRGDSVSKQQAIFTRDIAYYVGYRRMIEYLSEQHQENKEPTEVFTFLMSGKFDPTNPAHLVELR